MSTDTSIAFLSYCRADSDFALKLAGDLKSAGSRLWMDQLDIHPGTPWDRAVQDALASAPCVLVILSTASVASENVGDEVSFALSKQKRIIPVLYRDCDVPLRLARLQHIDFRTDYAGGLQALVKALGSAPDPGPKPGAAGPLASSVQPTLQKDTGASHRVTSESDEFPAVVSVREPRALDQVVAKDSTLPLSAKNYAVIAVAGLIIAVGFTLFYIYQVPKLVANGSQGQIFYLLLIPWALSCAAFLFGAMKSYARFTYKHLGNFLELGGPVILFCLVLVGGFKLVPPEPETFDLTVRAHSADQHDPIITSGKITIDLDNDRRTAVLGTSGEAEYKGIPAKFKGASLKVLPQVDGYDQQWQEHQIAGSVLDLALVRAALPVTILTGTISPPPGKGKSVRIFVEGQKSETSADDLGRFELSVNGKPGDRVVVKVYVDGKQVYDDFEVLPGPVTLSLHKPDTARREAPHGSSSATPVQIPITQGPGSALSINQQGALQWGRLILTRIRT